jgi:hypothetical protein
MHLLPCLPGRFTADRLILSRKDSRLQKVKKGKLEGIEGGWGKGGRGMREGPKEGCR